MSKESLEAEKEKVEKQFNQNRDTIEKLSNDVRMLTARQEQLKGQHQLLTQLIAAEKEENKAGGIPEQIPEIEKGLPDGDDKN